jgi:hypothetical protein
MYLHANLAHEPQYALAVNIETVSLTSGVSVAAGDSVGGMIAGGEANRERPSV